MKVEVRKPASDPDVTILDIRGHVDRGTVQEVERAIAEQVNRGRNRLVIHCAEMASISSDGMGIFLSYLIKIRKAGGDIKFAAMTPAAQTVLQVLGLTNLLQVFPDERQALQRFREEKRKTEVETQDEKALAVRLLYLPDGLAVVKLRGFIDRHTIDQVEASLRRALTDAKHCIVIDCQDLSYISSTGLGMLINYLKEARKDGGDIRLSSMQESVRTMFRLLGLDYLFQILATEADALASFRQPKS